MNDFSTSIGRTTKWERLEAAECTGIIYRKEKHRFVCRESALLQMEYFDGKIYEIRPADDSWSYIGMTVQDAEAREIQHHNKATNAIMKSAMDEPDVKMNVLVEYKCTKLELARIETESIQRGLRNKITMYNKQRRKFAKSSKRL